jgi:hypothetical protein
MKMVPFIVAATVVSIFSAWFYLLPKRKKRLIWNRKSRMFLFVAFMTMCAIMIAVYVSTAGTFKLL